MLIQCVDFKACHPIFDWNVQIFVSRVEVLIIWHISRIHPDILIHSAQAHIKHVIFPSLRALLHTQRLNNALVSFELFYHELNCVKLLSGLECINYTSTFKLNNYNT